LIDLDCMRAFNRAYLGKIPDVRIPKDMLDLAIQIINAKAGHFQPKKFEDHYESAIRELIKRKRRGDKIEKPKERPPAEVINLMDALRQSAAGKRDVVHTQQRRSAGTPLDRSTVRSRKARRSQAELTILTVVNSHDACAR
jgi:DNA end-binding protein Ku